MPATSRATGVHPEADEREGTGAADGTGIEERQCLESEVGDDPNEHGTEAHREKLKVGNSATSDRRRRQCHKSCETNDHHG